VTYDDVAEIKAMLVTIIALLERMANTLDRIESDTSIIEDNVADVAHALRPQVTE